MPSGWDVNTYKTDYESEEHWELRRNFMLAHKDTLPEDEVVCLAQVFINIELLGCRYPEETMQKVAKLAKGVVESYREKKKNCLKRTFVAASDAAVAKVKGQTSSPEVNQASGKKKSKNRKGKSKTKVKTPTNMGCDINSDINRCIWDEVKISGHTNCHSENLTGENGNKRSVKKKTKTVDILTSTSSNSTYSLDPNSIKRLNEIKPRFVFFLYDEPPVNLLERNASLNKGYLRWHFEGQKDQRTCSVYYNNIFLGSSGGRSPKKTSKEKAATEAIKNLRSLFYTVKIKAHVKCINKVTPAALGLSESEKRLKSDIGEQIMKLMGWSGGGLGVKQQGIIQPVSLLSNCGREGLGLNQVGKQDRGFRSRACSFLKRWIQTDSEEDLVFTPDFTHSQREILHKLASDLNLKSRSYGKDKDRYIVIYKKPVPWLIVEKLVKMGGSSNRYELIVPTVTIA